MSLRHSRRSIGGVFAVALLSLALAATPAGQAAADPVALPGGASEAMQKLTDLSRQSEQTNEALNNARVELDKKLAVQKDSEARQIADKGVLDVARANIARFQPAIDRVAVATYQGARTNRLFSVLLSDSPQQLLDQMSALDVISTETGAQVSEYKKAVNDAASAERASEASTDAARIAAEQAKSVSSDLQKKQSELQVAIGQVTQAWGALSGGERSALIGSPFPPNYDPQALLKSLAPGTSTGALIAALTRVGDPYAWGATGPNQFDCSGLVLWAYKQVGRDLPRTSQAQMAGGTPVDKQDLQPGDVVGFYSDASHVGIYAGNGNVLHASTFGVPVQVAPMGSFPYYGARRY